MYLSQLKINHSHQQAKQDLANPYELHRTIMRAFPNPLPADERVLFRVETMEGRLQPIVLVQSEGRPDWKAVETTFDNYFVQAPAVKALDGLIIQRGDMLRFRLRANPSKRVQYGKDEHSKRISLFSEADRMDWIKRKSEAAGFQLLEESLLIRDAPYRTFLIAHAEKARRATLNIVDYDGLLRVGEPALFLAQVSRGIGPAKGLGCGLLSFARA